MRAIDAQRAATKKGQETEAAREQARTAAAEAKAEAERTRRLYYAASMGLVQAAWESHNILQVQDLLAETAALPEGGFEWYYWQRLRRVEHLTLAGHRGGVTAVAFAPDGKRLVTGVTDGTVRVWDAASGQEIFCLRGHQGQVTAVAYAPDGQWLVTGSTDGMARIWDAASGRELRRIQGQNTGAILGRRRDSGWEAGGYGQSRSYGQGLGCRQCPGTSDPSRAHWPGMGGGGFSGWAVAGDGKSGWDGDGVGCEEWPRYLPPLVPFDSVVSVAVSADSKRLVTGTWNGAATFWDAETGRQLMVFRGTDPVHGRGGYPGRKPVGGRRRARPCQDMECRIRRGPDKPNGAPALDHFCRG